MARLELNLAARPFVNTGPLAAAAGVVAIALAVFSFLNFFWLFDAWAEARRLSGVLAVNQAEIEEAKRSTKALSDALDERERRQVRALAVSTTDLIQKRRLRWTRLLEQLEAVLPRDVRVLSISPDINERRMTLLMDAVAKDNSVKLKFYNKLQAPPFRDAYVLGETLEDGKIRFQIRCNYDPGGPDAEPIWEPMPWQLVKPTPTPSPTLWPSPAAGAAGAPADPSVPGPARSPAADLAPAPRDTPVPVPPEVLGGFGDPGSR